MFFITRVSFPYIFPSISLTSRFFSLFSPRRDFVGNKTRGQQSNLFFFAELRKKEKKNVSKFRFFFYEIQKRFFVLHNLQIECIFFKYKCFVVLSVPFFFFAVEFFFHFLSITCFYSVEAFNYSFFSPQGFWFWRKKFKEARWTIMYFFLNVDSKKNCTLSDNRMSFFLFSSLLSGGVFFFIEWNFNVMIPLEIWIQFWFHQQPFYIFLNLYKFEKLLFMVVKYKYQYWQLLKALIFFSVRKNPMHGRITNLNLCADALCVRAWDSSFLMVQKNNYLLNESFISYVQNVGLYQILNPYAWIVLK